MARPRSERNPCQFDPQTLHIYAALGRIRLETPNVEFAFFKRVLFANEMSVFYHQQDEMPMGAFSPVIGVAP